jgi:hypothetical protein
MLALALALLFFSAAAALPRSPFGIGAYFPPGGQQIPVAADLVGRGGWVLILIPCGNVTSETALPPRWGTFDPAASKTQLMALLPFFQNGPKF